MKLNINEIPCKAEQTKPVKLKRVMPDGKERIFDLEVNMLDADQMESLNDIFPEKPLMGRKGDTAKQILHDNDDARTNRVYAHACIALRNCIDFGTENIRKQVKLLRKTMNAPEAMHIFAITSESSIVPESQAIEEAEAKLDPTSTVDNGISISSESTQPLITSEENPTQTPKTITEPV